MPNSCALCREHWDHREEEESLMPLPKEERQPLSRAVRAWGLLQPMAMRVDSSPPILHWGAFWRIWECFLLILLRTMIGRFFCGQCWKC